MVLPPHKYRPFWPPQNKVYREGNINFFLQAYMPFIHSYCQNLDKFSICISAVRHFLEQDVNGYYLREDWYNPDPEDEEVQVGDKQLLENLGKIGFEAVKMKRRENRLKKRAARQLEMENALLFRALKPLIDENIPKMKNLQTLEVRRRRDDDVDEFTGPWIHLDIANDAKIALSAAVLKRSKGMEAEKRMLAQNLQDKQPEPINSCIPQLDLPDQPPVGVRQRQHVGRGRGRGRGNWNRGDGGGNHRSAYRDRGGNNRGGSVLGVPQTSLRGNAAVFQPGQPFAAGNRPAFAIDGASTQQDSNTQQNADESHESEDRPGGGNRGRGNRGGRGRRRGISSCPLPVLYRVSSIS